MVVVFVSYMATSTTSLTKLSTSSSQTAPPTSFIHRPGVVEQWGQAEEAGNQPDQDPPGRCHLRRDDQYGGANLEDAMAGDDLFDYRDLQQDGSRTPEQEHNLVALKRGHFGVAIPSSLFVSWWPMLRIRRGRHRSTTVG